MTARLHRDINIDAPPRPLSQSRIAVIVENKFLDAGTLQGAFNLILDLSFSDRASIRIREQQAI